LSLGNPLRLRQRRNIGYRFADRSHPGSEQACLATAHRCFNLTKARFKVINQRPCLADHNSRHVGFFERRKALTPTDFRSNNRAVRGTAERKFVAARVKRCRDINGEKIVSRFGRDRSSRGKSGEQCGLRRIPVFAGVYGAI
jgi:hypothetical protein